MIGKGFSGDRTVKSSSKEILFLSISEVPRSSKPYIDGHINSYKQSFSDEFSLCTTLWRNLMSSPVRGINIYIIYSLNTFHKQPKKRIDTPQSKKNKIGTDTGRGGCV